MSLLKVAAALEKVAGELRDGASGWLLVPLLEQAWARAQVGVDASEKDSWLVAQGVIFAFVYDGGDPLTAKELAETITDTAFVMREAVRQSTEGR